jgi:hypothetical protein
MSVLVISYGVRPYFTPSEGKSLTRKSLARTLAAAALLLACAAAAAAQSAGPKTVRDFFELLPQKYFPLEGCADNPTKRNCDRARAEYLRTFLEVEDTKNGYMRGGCDGAQSCFQMALFKRPDDYYEQLAAKYRALKTAGVDQALRAALNPDAFTYVVVGDAAKVKPQLEKLGMPIEVVEAP